MFFFFQAEDGIRDLTVTGVQTCALPISEIYYYKKQIDAHTPMVLVLEDGEEIEGTIEWYDRGALKINRRSAPNLLVLKRHIKYIYKADERTPQMTRVEDSLPQATES